MKRLISRCALLVALTMSITFVPFSGADAQNARMWGISSPGIPTDLSTPTALASSVGSRPGVLMWYVAWSYNSAFPTAAATSVRQWGAVPEITWEPWNPTRGVNQTTYSLARIAKGNYDRYIKSWAVSIKAWGGPVRIRFAHEMNGNWYPWAEGVNGNAAGSYIAAWRHVRSVFASVGASNVTWVWSPNVPYSGSVPLAQVFPGDTDVDEVALDGYNWGTTQTWSTWQSFADIFGPGLSQLASLSARPVSIGEVGSTEAGGNKAQWISDMWATLATWPQVRGLVWFDFNKETDWRIDSSPGALNAFAAGVGGYLAG